MKAENLKEYAKKWGWDLQYSKQTQDWVIRRIKDKVTFLIDPIFEEVASIIAIENYEGARRSRHWHTFHDVINEYFPWDSQTEGELHLRSFLCSLVRYVHLYEVEAPIEIINSERRLLIDRIQRLKIK